MFSAFKYVEENKGIDTEKSYPYEAVCIQLTLFYFFENRKM